MGKLRETFGNVKSGQDHNSDCEKVAEEFAIKFYDWCKKNVMFRGSDLLLKTDKELLRIFKEENRY
ncbi:hypothetical protein [Flavobacterium sp.]|uniref:hypothetical protein n=1 Tax=Flavobacterium sp. TaxID=239 RepID=UPI003D6AAC34